MYSAPARTTPASLSIALLTLSLLALVSACGNESASAGATADAVGAPCVAEADCAFGGATCIDGLPGGYCTLDCPVGGCPQGTACAEFGDGRICARTCTTDLECRNGYRCNVPSGQTLGICDVDYSGPPVDAGDDTGPADAGDSDAVDAGEDAAEDSGDDTTPADSGDSSTEDVMTDAPADTVADTTEPPDTTVPPDTRPDTVEPPAPIGTSCGSDEECTEGPSPQCVGWLPEGYCSSGCESDADCGPGNICASAGFGPTLCMDGCASDADCRDGYGCCSWAGPACLPSWSCF